MNSPIDDKERNKCMKYIQYTNCMWTIYDKVQSPIYMIKIYEKYIESHFLWTFINTTEEKESNYILKTKQNKTKQNESSLITN